MAYAVKSSELKDASYLSHGVNEDVSIKETKHYMTEPKKEGDESYDVRDIVFSSKMGEYRLRLFNPDTASEDIKEREQQYVASTMVYILHKLLNKDVEVPASVTDFASLNKWFDSMLPANYTTTLFYLKLVGNVYKGKANIGATRYFGWLERKDSGKKPVLGVAEIAGNVAYDKFQANKANGGNAADAAKDAAPSEESLF